MSNAVEVEDEGQDYCYSNWMFSTTTGSSATTLSSASSLLGGLRNWNDIQPVQFFQLPQHLTPCAKSLLLCHRSKQSAIFLNLSITTMILMLCTCLFPSPPFFNNKGVPYQLPNFFQNIRTPSSAF